MPNLQHDGHKGGMGNEERWTVARATNFINKLLDQVITTRKSIFIDGDCRPAVVISMEEWVTFQEKLIS